VQHRPSAPRSSIVGGVRRMASTSSQKLPRFRKRLTANSTFELTYLNTFIGMYDLLSCVPEPSKEVFLRKQRVWEHSPNGLFRDTSAYNLISAGRTHPVTHRRRGRPGSQRAACRADPVEETLAADVPSLAENGRTPAPDGRTGEPAGQASTSSRRAKRELA
jgi:hypothetical protein